MGSIVEKLTFKNTLEPFANFLN